MNNFLLLRLKTLLSILLLIDLGVFLNNWHWESILKYSAVITKLTASKSDILGVLLWWFWSLFPKNFDNTSRFFYNFALGCSLYLIVWNSIKGTTFLKSKCTTGFVYNKGISSFWYKTKSLFRLAPFFQKGNEPIYHKITITENERFIIMEKLS